MTIRPEKESWNDAPVRGASAPDFTLSQSPVGRLSLSSLRGRPVVLAFYPADWSPVCDDEMMFFNRILPEFRRFGAALLGISVDGPWCHRAFAAARALEFPLLSDSEPKGAVAMRYGVYGSAEGTSRRAMFLVDPFGVIRWRHASSSGVNAGGVLIALQDLHLPDKLATKAAARLRAARWSSEGVSRFSES